MNLWPWHFPEAAWTDGSLFPGAWLIFGHYFARDDAAGAAVGVVVVAVAVSAGVIAMGTMVTVSAVF